MTAAATFDPTSLPTETQPAANLATVQSGVQVATSPPLVYVGPDPGPNAIPPNPTAVESNFDRTVWFCLQLAHRFSIVVFLLLLGVWFMMFKAAGYETLLAACGGFALTSILFAGIAVLMSRRRPATRAEGRGLLLFNGIVFSIVLYTMLFSRLTYFRIKLQPLTNAPPQTELPR